VTMAELVHAVRREGARTIADVVQRRIMVGHGADLGMPAADALAAPLGELLGWDSARRSQELRRYAEEIEERRLPARKAGAAPTGEGPAPVPKGR
jgi:glycerol-3-phosphate dehydrogenase